ncbi:hypothetical protein DM02DRAFT_608233 [Periconia macrospinosa]|uniref:DUF7907 domain-containing protein n=1 Tax=Periconia macrospinosa TaxID=97972 RepID=A0A2V1EC98_9PLEO|nr:hypothetical protein DM02DRAFT_608233 [Periconia macrospinosa]
MYILSSLFLLLPTLTHQQLPPTTKKHFFNILAIIPPETPLANVSTWSLTSSPLSSTTTPSVPILLTPNRTSGSIFYENGTAETFASRASQILTDGDGGVAWATTLQAPGEENSQVLLVRAGKGYPGFQVAEWPATVYLETGTWFVCEVGSEGEGEVVALFWRRKNTRTPEGCSNAELQAWCVEGDGPVEHEFGRRSTCYEEI